MFHRLLFIPESDNQNSPNMWQLWKEMGNMQLSQCWGHNKYTHTHIKQTLIAI